MPEKSTLQGQNNRRVGIIVTKRAGLKMPIRKADLAQRVIPLVKVSMRMTFLLNSPVAVHDQVAALRATCKGAMRNIAWPFRFLT